MGRLKTFSRRVIIMAVCHEEEVAVRKVESGGVAHCVVGMGVIGGGLLQG